MNNNHLEKIIDQALSLIENGKSASEILGMLPEYKNELEEIFQILDLFNVKKEKIVSSRELLAKIIANIPTAQSVTEKEVSRYLYRGKQKPNNYVWQKGRSSKTIIKLKIHDLMTINWKVWAPLGIVAVVAFIVVGSYQFGTKAPQAPIAEETPQAPVAVLQELPVAVTKLATGNIDDSVNAILADISDDQALFADTEKDAELIVVDSQAISDFSQSYNENEF